jgi:hypothetical protein
LFICDVKLGIQEVTSKTRRYTGTVLKRVLEKYRYVDSAGSGYSSLSGIRYERDKPFSSINAGHSLATCVTIICSTKVVLDYIV